MPEPDRPARHGRSRGRRSRGKPARPIDLGAVRVVATDLDNTLLRPDKTVGPRTGAALAAAREAGLQVVPVTARQRSGVAAVLPWQDWAVCSNGAFVVHMGTGQRLFEQSMEVSAQYLTVQRLAEAVPGIMFCAVRDGGEGFYAEPAYAEVSEWGDHNRDPRDMVLTDRDGLAAVPNLKLVARHATKQPRELLAVFESLGLAGVQATSSGAPFVEIAAAGTGKARGLSELCAHLGVDVTQVIAVGDGLNDNDMIAWAGLGIAVANAQPETLLVADEIAPAAADDGVAMVVEMVLAAR